VAVGSLSAVRFSLTFGAAGPGRDPRGLAELARLAEDVGWDAVFLEAYIVYQADASLPAYDPWISLAAMASVTSRIRLGTTVTPVPRRHPWKLAAEAVALDHLSGGRVILGVGAGDPADPSIGRVIDGSSQIGDGSDRRVLAERLDEALGLIDALWSGEPVHYAGAHYRVDGLQLAARPVQRPRIPVWVGGDLTKPGVRRRIRRWDGSCAYKGRTDRPQSITPTDVSELLAEVAEERGSGGGFDVKVSGDDSPGLIADLVAAGATWWGRWVGPADPEVTRGIVLAGPPAIG
jgi:alkanesulfonate monooxygenase SsuD/methylene tetrahydromethanopterin reductase-like flavin-dependent oxidoreductase (luciferase family)